MKPISNENDSLSLLGRAWGNHRNRCSSFDENHSHLKIVRHRSIYTNVTEIGFFSFVLFVVVAVVFVLFSFSTPDRIYRTTIVIC